MKNFIAFDGPNGVGKSTLIENVHKELLGKDIDVYLTAEPTKSKLGKFTREMSEELTENSLACLVAADRYHHIEKEIKPVLNEGKIVLCDRYLASSLVFQRMDGVDKEFILSMNRRIILPDLYFIMNVSPAILTQRLIDRGETLTRFEVKKENQEKEHIFYKEAVRDLKALGIPVVEIDGKNKPEECTKLVCNKIFSYLNI